MCPITHIRCKIWNDSNVYPSCSGWGFKIFLLQLHNGTITEGEIKGENKIKEKMSKFSEKIILLFPRESAGKEKSKLYDAVEVNNKTGSGPQLRSKYIGQWLRDKGYIKDCKNTKDYIENAEFIFELLCKSKEEIIFKLVAVKIKIKDNDEIITGEDLFKDRHIMWNNGNWKLAI